MYYNDRQHEFYKKYTDICMNTFCFRQHQRCYCDATLFLVKIVAASGGAAPRRLSSFVIARMTLPHISMHYCDNKYYNDAIHHTPSDLTCPSTKHPSTAIDGALAFV